MAMRPLVSRCVRCLAGFACTPTPATALLHSSIKTSQIKKKYSFGSQLGSGNYAVVFEGTKKNATDDPRIPMQVAIKAIDKSKVQDIAQISREIDIMSEITHKHIISLYEVFDVKRAPHVQLPCASSLFEAQSCALCDMWAGLGGAGAQNGIHRDGIGHGWRAL